MLSEIEYMLTYGGTPVGYRLHGVGSPQINLTTEPKVIHPLWWKNTIIDGRYSAATFQFPFQVTLVGSSTFDYQNQFYVNTQWLDSTNAGPTVAKTLNITRVATADFFGNVFPGSVVMTYGKCFFAGAQHSEPSDILLSPFGILEVKFFGSSRPVFVS